MLMRAESRSADPGRRAGQAHLGGVEGGPRAGDQSRAAGVAKGRRRARGSPGTDGSRRRLRRGNGTEARGGTVRSVRAGVPPAARVVCTEGGAGGGCESDHVTGGPPPFCPAEAVFRAQRVRRRHSRRDGASVTRVLPPPAPAPAPASLRPACFPPRLRHFVAEHCPPRTDAAAEPSAFPPPSRVPTLAAPRLGPRSHVL